MKPFASSTTWGVLAISFILIFVLGPPLGIWPSFFATKFWWWLIASIHLLFSVGIARDAVNRNDRGELLFVEPLTWAIAVLVFGFIVVTLYWLMHYSRLKGE